MPRSVRLALAVLLAAASVHAQSHPTGADVDVTGYRFAISLPDALDRIDGQATVNVVVLRDGVDALTLDLVGLRPDGKGMTVTAVSAGGRTELAYTHDGDRLTIRLGRDARAGDRLTVTVFYGGVPADGLILGTNRHGERVAFGDNWPERARNWLPTLDRPDDKATVEWSVSAPAAVQVIANGRLVEQTDTVEGVRLTRYVEAVPIPTYGMVIGVARFAVERLDAPGCDVPLESWAYPQDRQPGFANLAAQRRAVDVFADLIAPYAFEKLAGVQSTTIYGGMENPSAIFYDEGAVADAAGMEALVAHEVAHHWFGNVVTETRWADLWLSEGFATYLTDVYVERTQGRDAMALRLAAERAGVFRLNEGSPDLPVVDTLTADPSGLLNANSYNKGAWVLHMLRREIGDAAFFDGLRAYYDAYRFRNATTSDFRRVMEGVAGRPLDAFFHQWLVRADEPEIEVRWRLDAGAVVVRVVQTQPGVPFTVPLDLGVRTDASGIVRRLGTVQVSSRETTARFDAPAGMTALVADPDVWLLARTAVARDE